MNCEKEKRATKNVSGQDKREESAMSGISLDDRRIFEGGLW